MDDTLNRAEPSILIVIANSKKAKKVSELFQETNLYLHYQFRAEGTASSEILDCLGLESAVKVVSLCIASRAMILQLLNRLQNKLYMSSVGEGIAFTMPLAGISSPIIKLLDNEVQEKITNQIESEVEKMKSDGTHDLVITMINQGFSEALMDAAMEAGATGGTIINARKIEHEKSSKFLGISIQPEKEIVAILTKKEDKITIMRAIDKTCGINTKAQGIVLALPVDRVTGLQDDYEL